MRVPVLLLANAAVVENELLNIAGGGWENYSCQTFPWAVGGVLCGVIEVPSEERHDRIVVDYSVRDHSGQDMGVKASTVFMATRGDGPARTVFTWPFSFVVTEPTLVDFVVSAGGEEVGVLSLPIRALPSNTD